MVEHNVRRYTCAILYSFLIIGLITYCGYWIFQGDNINIWEVITTSISVTTLLVTSFVIWAWKWKIFQGWLVPFPNLNGKWKGNIKYTFEGKDQNRCSTTVVGTTDGTVADYVALAMEKLRELVE